MEKILLLTDSASDLTPEDEARTGIRVLNLPVSVEGKEYTDRVDLTPDEMYQILNTCKELPTTAHLTMVRLPISRRCWARSCSMSICPSMRM